MKIARSKSHFSACSFIDFDVLLLLGYCDLNVCITKLLLL